MIQPDPRDPDVLPIASISGGKDSTALSLHLTEQGIEHIRVFADTGWEHPDTYAHLDVLEKKIGPIHRVESAKYPGGFASLVTHRGMFPSRIRRMCTQELKVFPIRDFVRQQADSTGCEVINVVGIRAAESKARSKMTEWEWQDGFDCYVWRPLIAWSEQAVIDIHKRHDVLPNPLYLKGASRVGCWPCIFSRKEEIALVARISPERIDQIRQLEHDVAEKAAARYALKGETFESLGYMRPTLFHDKGRKMTPIPIDDVVDWSKTAYGGKQYKLFSAFEDEQSGCMRWGMCEGHPDESEAAE
jgi:3'-phosphoadenosine 5'-phosphosulfate sulfotransferase (PAPS reductase)/FAD synthetase